MSNEATKEELLGMGLTPEQADAVIASRTPAPSATETAQAVAAPDATTETVATPEAESGLAEMTQEDLDILAEMAKFNEDAGGGNGDYDNDLKFWRPNKAGTGVYHFRLYRVYRDGKGYTHTDNPVHFQGPGRPPVTFGTPESLEIQARIEQLRLAGDPGSIKQADKLEVAKQKTAVIRLRGQDGHHAWDQSQNQFRQTLLAIAQVAGYTGSWPWPDSATPAEQVAFMKFVRKGEDMVCGPKGVDLTVNYSKPKGKATYVISILPANLMATAEERTTYEDDETETPDPEVVRARIAEAMANKAS